MKEAEEMAASSAGRGLDGLTAAELAASRRGWWDGAFTESLLRRVPGGSRKLVDVGCGLATTAHTLLPKLSTILYVGVDADAQRLREAEQLLAGLPYRDRIELRVGRAEQLPCADCEAEVVLTSMTLQHLPDPAAAIRDIARVLARDGVLIAIEPDNTANEFYFNGVLVDVTAAFRELFKAQRRHRRPADIAIGPAVASLVEREGLEVREFFPSVIGRAKKTSGKAFFSGLAQVVDIAAASLPAETREVEACRTALTRGEAVVGPSTMGYGCQLVPVFVCVARKT